MYKFILLIYSIRTKQLKQFSVLQSVTAPSDIRHKIKRYVNYIPGKKLITRTQELVRP